MAAPDEISNGGLCAKCFAPLAAEATYCPECGAPTGDATPAADSVVHAELAQANVLRLRGDLAGSEKALLAVLRRYPNDPHAHEMLGDVCAARGEPERAAEWYELALDLSPNAPDVRGKLARTREGLDERDVADTAETLGLPSARAGIVWWPLAVSAALLVLAVLVVAWPRRPAPAPFRASVEAPVAPAVPVEPAPTPSTTTVVPTPPPTPTGTEEDRRLLADLQAKAGAVRVQSVSLDPRTQTLAVEFEVGEVDDARTVATALGREALAVAPTAMMASLRAVRAGRLVFAADLARSAMSAADPLTNLWPPPEPSADPLAPTGGATGTPAPPTATTG